MIFKAWKDKVWEASTRIKACLKDFFGRLLKGKLGKNTCYGPGMLAEAHHQMLCTEASPSSTAQSMGLAHTTLTRKLQRFRRDEVWNALSSVMDSMLKVKERLLIVDFIHLNYTGRELLHLTTGTKQGYVFKVLAAASGRVICYLAPMSMLDFKEDLLKDLLQRAGSGRVFVSDAEFSSKECLKELWIGVDQGTIKGFVVRGNPRWHRLLYRFKGSPLGCRGRVKLWGRNVWVYKVKLGREIAYLLSSSRDLGPDLYKARWAIEVYFRDAKGLLPRMCLHTLAARLAVFASCIIASAVLRLLQVSKGMWKSRVVNAALGALALIDLAHPTPHGREPGQDAWSKRKVNLQPFFFVLMLMIVEVELDRVRPGEFRLRDLDEAVVEDLAKSIGEAGLLQPVAVRPLGDGYELVFGLHRLEACRRLGWEKIPAIVKHVSDEESFLLNLVENLQRNVHINPIAEAQGYKHLIEKGWTMVEIAEKIGKSCSYVCERLRVLNRLHPKVRKRLSFTCVKTSALTISHAEYLSLIDDPQQQLRLAKTIEEERLSVRQLERMVRRLRRLEETMPEGCLCRECPNYPCRKIV